MTLDDPFLHQTARSFTPPTTGVGTLPVTTMAITSTRESGEGPISLVSLRRAIRDFLGSSTDLENDLFSLGPDFTGFISSDLLTLEPIPEVLSCQENAQFAARGLALSKSDLASIFNVTRPTIYNWLNGTEPEDQRHHRKLRILGSIAKDVSRKTLRPPYKGLIHDLMPGESTSLLDLLREDTWEEAELRRLFLKARDLTTQRDERLGNYPPSSLEEDERNLFENILSLDEG